MSYPLIILGAGASYDFLDESSYAESEVFHNKLQQNTPPLTNNIFDSKRFYELIDKYDPHIPRLASYINTKLKAKDANFEEILTVLRKDKIEKNQDLSQQLIALRFYLADLFSSITENYYRHINNHLTLIEQIKLNGGKACVVNFNYDLLFEKAYLSGIPENLSDYISNDIKIIKLHGTYNWFYFRKINGRENRSSYDYSLIGSSYILSEEKKYEILVKKTNSCKNLPSDEQDSMTRFTYLPAIALPLKSKTDYICPDNHIEALNSSLTQIDKVLIVGWKAGDPYLVDILRNQLKDKNIPIAIACGKNSIETIKSNLGDDLTKKIQIVDMDGYSSFLKNKSEKFLED